MFMQLQTLASKSKIDVPKLSPEAKTELMNDIAKFKESKGFKSFSELASALKKDKELSAEFNKFIGERAKALGLFKSDKVDIEKGGKAVGTKVLRDLVADEKNKQKLLKLVGGNEAFLKNADTARTLLAEIKAEVGEDNTVKFLMKYNSDKGFRKQVNQIIEEKLKDERFAAFAGLSPEEVLKGSAAVQYFSMSRSEKLREFAPVFAKEFGKVGLLSFGTGATSLVEQMTLMVTAATIGQLPGGAQAMWAAYYTSREAGGVFGSVYSDIAKKVNENSSQLRLAAIEQLIKDTQAPSN